MAISWRLRVTGLAIASVLGLGIVTGCSPDTPTAQTETQPEAAQPQVYAEEGLAIRGTDPVAYFTEAAPVQGSPEYEFEWMGATWQFASAENRDLFASEPERYAPQYGGYCAWAVSQGSTAPVDPAAWAIVDDKLYLNLSPDVQERWQKDIPGNIAKANENWPDVLSQ